MLAPRLALPFLALVLLGAHFYRAGDWALLAIAVALLALFFVRHAWAARTLQAGIVLGALEWLRTTAALVAQRQGMGAPYLRLAVILGAVTLVTVLAVFVFRSAVVRRHFRMPVDSGQNAPRP